MTRLAVVTGGTRGIGRAIAARLGREGYEVVAAARTPPAAPLPAGARFAECDVAVAASVAALFGPLPRVDLLVNNAGIAGANPLDGPDDALWHAILGSNLTGAYLCAKHALTRLPDETGRIVNVASVLGLRGVADQTAYCAAKHGMIGLTRSLAMALAPRRITVNAVCPGFVPTEMAARRWDELGLDAARAAATIPTGRLTEPEEVAAVVAFLAGPGAANITGQTLAIDGGSLARP